MIDDSELMSLYEKIGRLRSLAEEILRAGSSIPAVERNAKRILASTAMLERNISDVRDFVV